MGGITGQKNTPLPPAVGHASLKGINPYTAQRLIAVRSDSSQKTADKGLFEGAIGIFVHAKFELIAADAIRTWQRNARPCRIAKHFCVETSV